MKILRPFTPINVVDYTNAENAAIRAIVEGCAQALNQFTEGKPMDHSIPEAIVKLKNEFTHFYTKQTFLREILPLSSSKNLPIRNTILQSLHKFAASNPIYVKSHDIGFSGMVFRVYEGDINNYWLSSKKHDTSYQPFYPTWMLSAFALAHGAESLGYKELVDIGSGDGRIAYCAKLLGMESFGLEIDADLVQLQRSISNVTGVAYNATLADATRFDYSALNLSKPIFLISGLPEMGEMLANSVINQIMSMDKLRHNAGFNFMGSHIIKSLARDHTFWGWGKVINNFNLDLHDTITLPTHWTTDQAIDTAYVYAKFR